MAFAVVCKSCQARFLLNDDLLRRKVAGRVVTVRCRQCHATIEVDGSDVERRSVPENAPPAPAPEPPAPKPITAKAAPSPPRPARSSTLMGIGTPGVAVRGGGNELVALSPGLLNMTPAPASPAAGARGFPEPPPPPGAVEELGPGDWEVSETPVLANAAPAAPTPAKTMPGARSDAAAVAESVDDFVEELPPSLPPPPEEQPPSSSGTPSLKTLAHHEQQAWKAPSDDFLSNMTAAMNGGIAADATGTAPTIDVSALSTAPAAAEAPPSIDISSFDAPRVGSKTVPLFALGASEIAAGPVARQASYAAPSASIAEGSLGPAALDRPARQGEATESKRARRNVVPPATKSVPPAAPGLRRSGLAAPVLLVLAAAAGFLIWKRNASTPTEPVTRAEEPTAHVAEPPGALAPTPVLAPPATPSAAVAAPAADDDITFETTPIKTATPALAVPHDKPPAASLESATPKPTNAPGEGKPESGEPIAKEPTPSPAGPTEPAGPFDRAAAAAALTAGAAQASACKKEGDPSGVASVVITFAPSGRVTSANVSGPPFAGTATGGCIANALRKAHVPPFEGERVTVSKTIVIQ